MAGDLSLSQGRRTPGYPLVIVLAGESPHAIFVAHMAIGVVIPILLFYIALLLSGRPAIAFVAGASYSVNLGAVVFLKARCSRKRRRR